MKKKTHIVKNLFKSIKKIYKIDKGYIIIRLISLLILPFNSYLYSLILLQAIKVLESDNPSFSALFNSIWLIVLICTIFSIYQRITNNLLEMKIETIEYKLKRDFTLETLEMDYEKLEQTTAQEEYEKARQALNGYSGLMGMIIKGFSFLNALLTLLLGCAIIFSVNVYLVIIILVLSLIKLFLRKYGQRKAKEIRDERVIYNRKNNYVNNISLNLSLGKDLRIYNMDKFINEERKSVTGKILENFKKENAMDSIIGTIINFLGVIDRACLYGFLIYEVLYNNMLISTFSFMLSSVYTLINSLNNLNSNIGNLYNNSLMVDDYNNFTCGKYNYNCKNYKLNDEQFSIEFKNVYYQYYGQNGYALEDVSFKINSKEKVALVGYNGAGKTTLVKLICGLYHPTKGNIYINGVDVNNIDRKELARKLSVVFQDYNIFSYSIASNISMQYKDYDVTKINNLLDLLGLKDKIDTFDNKLDTLLGRDFDDDGIDLSGGEKQKVLIARGCYKDSEIYILDEPTSAMDAISEANLYEHFNDLIKDKASVFISHRLSSTKICDKIIVLENGKIEEIGSHNELIKNDLLYKKLFQMQAEYYKKEES